MKPRGEPVQNVPVKLGISRLRLLSCNAVALSLAICVCACGEETGDSGMRGGGSATVLPTSTHTATASPSSTSNPTPTATPTAPPALIAVLSAFPAEMAPVLALVTVDHTAIVNGRVFRVGVLAELPVVVGLTGIGLVNAAATTRAVLEQFEVKGIVVSAVAGSSVLIGDVLVPMAWQFRDGTAYSAHQEWLDVANQITASGIVALQRCTELPADPSHAPVCVQGLPTIIVGGIGQSTDPFISMPFPCQPDGGDIYGCDVAAGTTAFADRAFPTSAFRYACPECRRGAAKGRRLLRANGFGRAPFVPSRPPPFDRAQDRLLMGRIEGTAAAEAPIANDMETAAIAREAAARGVPFIAFRAVSDGAGDPLGLPNFLEQFATYYRLAARNAAAVTLAFLERLAAP